MVEKVQEAGSGLDTVKLVLAGLIVAAGIGGFYVYGDQPLLYRVLGLVALVIVAGGIGLTTMRGKALTTFMQGARTEVRKMVWPTRVETMQTTMLIFVVVILVGLFLWLLDSALGAFMRLVIS